MSNPNPLPKTLTAADTIAITMRVALEHHDRGQLEEAAALYREVLGMDAAHAEALFLLGFMEASAANLWAAIQLMRAAVRAQPQAVHMHRALAETLLRAGRAAAALHSYWRILSLEPDSAMAYVNVGDVMAAIKPHGGNDSAAASCYRRALALDQNCASAHLGLGHIHLRAGHILRAEAEYRAAIVVDHRQAASQAALGQVLMHRQQYAEAADAFRRAILLQPRSPEWLERLGDALHHLGQKVRADGCYRRAEQLVSRNKTLQNAGEGYLADAKLRRWPTGAIALAPGPRLPPRNAALPLEGRIVTQWEVIPVQ